MHSAEDLEDEGTTVNRKSHVDNREMMPLLLGAGALALVLAVSNVLVQYPINDWVTYGAFSYPLSLLVVDICNRLKGAAFAYRIVLIGFVCGMILSYVFSTPRIATASVVTFLIIQSLNVYVFDRLRNRQWWQAPLISSSLSSSVDSFLFFSLAFLLTPVPWFTLALGDLIVKLITVLSVLPLYRLLSVFFVKFLKH